VSASVSPQTIATRHPGPAFNITLHGVGEPTRALEPGEHKVWLSRRDLQRVLDEAHERDNVRITVDDGNRSDADIVQPELDRRGLSAIFFIVGARLGYPDFVGVQDVQALLAAGHAVGSHGMRHRAWRRLGREALDLELSTARKLLESIAESPITELSCPFGSYDRRVLRRVRELGYDRLYTSDGGPVQRNAWLQPRTTISSSGAPSITELSNPSRPAVLLTSAKRTVKQWR
jgi:peptidoglycan/xylan/chitin deacetylase (PgdA/CDA1 family)